MKLHAKSPRSVRYGILSRSMVAFVSLFLFGTACVSKKQVSGPSLHVLTYSSLGSKNGFLDSVKTEFETQSKCTLLVDTTLGATQVLSYLDEPKQRDQIDLVMGVDLLLFERAKNYFYLADPESFHPKDQVIPILKDQIPQGFIPLDYGALSFIYRKADFKGKILPTHLSDFLKPELRHKWIVQDPRSSSPGMLFFLFADSLALRINDLKKQWSTLAPSWDSSYKMFMAHDSSMDWSYLTSLAYHASKNELDQYGSIDFVEGLPLQLEGMAALNRVGNPYTANPCLEKWVQFVLNPLTQAKMVSKQYMMPVVPNVKLPQYFDQVPAVKKIARLDLTIEKVDHLISRFGREVQGDSF